MLALEPGGELHRLGIVDPLRQRAATAHGLDRCTFGGDALLRAREGSPEVVHAEARTDEGLPHLYQRITAGIGIRILLEKVAEGVADAFEHEIGRVRRAAPCPGTERGNMARGLRYPQHRPRATHTPRPSQVHPASREREPGTRRHFTRSSST